MLCVFSTRKAFVGAVLRGKPPLTGFMKLDGEPTNSGRTVVCDTIGVEGIRTDMNHMAHNWFI